MKPSPKKHPTLVKLILAKKVWWNFNGDAYLGRASDGEEVVIGFVYGKKDLDCIESYLKVHSTQDTG